MKRGNLQRGKLGTADWFCQNLPEDLRENYAEHPDSESAPKPGFADGTQQKPDEKPVSGDDAAKADS